MSCNRIVVSTSRCGRDNPGSNPGYSNCFILNPFNAIFEALIFHFHFFLFDHEFRPDIFRVETSHTRGETSLIAAEGRPSCRSIWKWTNQESGRLRNQKSVNFNCRNSGPKTYFDIEVTANAVKTMNVQLEYCIIWKSATIWFIPVHSGSIRFHKVLSRTWIRSGTFRI